MAPPALALALAALKYGPAAYSLGKSLFGGGGGGGDRAGDAAQRRFRAQAAREGWRGGDLTGQFDTEITGFDPMEYMNTAAGGMTEQFKHDFAKNLEGVRGNQVGRGRSGTGFGFEEEDELFEGMSEDLNRRMAQLAMQGGRMNLSRIGMMGGAGERAMDRSMDANFGEYATEREARERRRAGTLGAVGNIGGALLNAGATFSANRGGGA